jgi:hypothetical protein
MPTRTKTPTKTKTTKRRSVRKALFSLPATIVAALIGGTFSLTSAILPSIMPPAAVVVKERAIVQASAFQAAASETMAVPVSIAGPQAVTSGLADHPSFATEPGRSPAAKPNLTYGVWTLFKSVDAQGTDWSNSTLKFTTQQETPDGLRLAGFFDWRAQGKIAGREYVVGNYVAQSKQLFVEGQATQNMAKKPLALTSFSAKLTDDGRRLADGTWGSTPGRQASVPGRWEARR